MEYKTRQWHEKCFSCCVCKTPIGTKSFIPREQEIYCAGCYEEKYATRCIKCNKVIQSIIAELERFLIEICMYSYLNISRCSLSRTDHYIGRRNLQERAMASWMLHLHKLFGLTGRSTLHKPWRKAILCRMLWRIVRQEMHIVH